MSTSFEPSSERPSKHAHFAPDQASGSHRPPEAFRKTGNPSFVREDGGIDTLASAADESFYCCHWISHGISSIRKALGTLCNFICEWIGYIANIIRNWTFAKPDLDAQKAVELKAHKEKAGQYLHLLNSKDAAVPLLIQTFEELPQVAQLAIKDELFSAIRRKHTGVEPVDIWNNVERILTESPKSSFLKKAVESYLKS